MLFQYSKQLVPVFLPNFFFASILYRLVHIPFSSTVCIICLVDRVAICFIFLPIRNIKNRIENKFGHFQYNLLYNSIPCKKNLYKWKINDCDKSCFCNCLEDYNHFFFVCKKDIQFWESFKKFLYVLTRIHFNLSLENSIYGWNIDKSNCVFVNFLFIIASFSVYKARIRFDKTNIFSPIWFIFNLEINRLNDIFKNTKNVPKVVLENKKDGMNKGPFEYTLNA